MIVAATFHGPNYERPNHDESSIEVFGNLGEVITTLFERGQAKGRRTLPVRYLSGAHGNVSFPAVTHGHYFKCWVLDTGTLPPIDQPPAEDDIVEALVAVHGATPDYTYALVADDQIAVRVGA